MSKIQPTRYERGCVHDIDHLAMSKVAEGTKIETKNQWVLTCHFGPVWAWHNPSNSWQLLRAGVFSWVDFELPGDVAYELLQTLKSKKQLEEEIKQVYEHTKMLRVILEAEITNNKM